MLWNDVFFVLTQCKKLGQFAMSKTCKNWLGLVNSCIYYACQTHEIYHVLLLSGFQSSLRIWNPLSKTGLSKCHFIWNDINLKSNLCLAPVNISPNLYLANPCIYGWLYWRFLVAVWTNLRRGFGYQMQLRGAFDCSCEGLLGRVSKKHISS